MLLASAGFFYTAQFVESLTSPTFQYISNMMDQDEAIRLLDGYTQTHPEINLTIKNYHMQKVKVEEEKKD